MKSDLKPISEDGEFVVESSGIRLSVLNPDISRKLNKFNTTSDGSLTLEQAIQGLIALQKQSNNYKRTLYLVLPILMLLVASVFGVTLLAINMSKDLKVNSDSMSLTTMSGNVVKVGLDTTTNDLFDVVWNPLRIGSLDYVSINGTILSVTDSYQTFSNNKCRAVIRTSTLTLVLDEINSAFEVEVHSNDTLSHEMKGAIDAWLNENFDSVVSDRQAMSRFVMRNVCTAGNYWCSTKKACLLNGVICPRPTLTKTAGSPSAGSHDGGAPGKNIPPPEPMTQGELGW